MNLRRPSVLILNLNLNFNKLNLSRWNIAVPRVWCISREMERIWNEEGILFFYLYPHYPKEKWTITCTLIRFICLWWKKTYCGGVYILNFLWENIKWSNYSLFNFTQLLYIYLSYLIYMFNSLDSSHFIKKNLLSSYFPFNKYMWRSYYILFFMFYPFQ